MEELRKEFHALKLRADKIEADVKANTEVTQSIKKDTEELVGLFNDFKGGARVLARAGKILKWLAGISTAIAALVAVIHTYHDGGPFK